MSQTSLKVSGLHEIVEQDESRQREIDEIVSGLSLPQKSLSPKFFYDERGSELFDEITRLPEYYLTATEAAIMADCIDEVADLIGPQASLIEFGAGSNQKIRLLRDHGMSKERRYWHDEVGYNYRMEGIQGAVLRGCSRGVWRRW